MITSKIDLRRKMRALRNDLAAQARGAGEAAAARLPLDQFAKFDPFAGYLSQGSEIDAGPLMRRLAATGARMALPAVTNRDAPLVFRLWDPNVALQPDALGVMAPPSAAEVIRPDLVIVPLLAFDRLGGRLGQGGGHYDRTLAELRQQRAVFALGLAHAGQETREIPMEAHDQRLDAILTETDFIPSARAR